LRALVSWAGTGVGARATTRASGPARAVGAWGRWNQWYRRYGRARAALASERAISRRYRRYGRSGSGTARQASGDAPHISKKARRQARRQRGEARRGGPVDGATRRAPLLNAGRPRNRHPRRYRCSRFWKGLERSESVSRGPALRVGFFAGTGVLASGKVWKEAKASLVVQPYGSASSPSLAASCAISPVRARSCGTGKRAGIPRLKNALHFSGAPNRAIAGETLYIYTRSVLIMMIVTPAGGRSAPALDAGARALLGPRVGAPGARAQKR
jgi:hypothetical protein